MKKFGMGALVFSAMGGITVVACSSGDGDGSADSTAALSSLTSLSDIEPGDACKYGGVTIAAGIDENGNDKLDSDEIDVSTNVCNGATGSKGASGEQGDSGDTGAVGASTLTSVVPASVTDCPSGGSVVSFGADLDGDQVLAANEVQKTVVTCNGVPGHDACAPILRTTPVGPDADCSAGGVLVAFGADAGAPGGGGAGGGGGASTSEACDGVLDDDEVQGFQEICNGTPGPASSALLKILGEVAGEHCTQGGWRIDLGDDDNVDGILEADEVNTTKYACEGGWVPLSSGTVCSGWTGAGVTSVHCGPTFATRDECATYCTNLPGGAFIQFGNGSGDYIAWGAAAQSAGEICGYWDATCSSSADANFWSAYESNPQTLCSGNTAIDCGNSWYTEGTSPVVACNCYQ